MSPTERCELTIHGRIYDVTEFLDKHPGGRDTLLEFNGLDASEAFDSVGHSSSAKKDMQVYYKGLALNNSEKVVDIPSTSDKSIASGFKFPSHTWYIVSSFIVCTAAVLGSYPQKYSLIDSLTAANPSPGQLGLGRWTILGQTKILFNYPFRLPTTTTGAIISSWLGYLIHQVGQYYILFSAQQQKDSGVLKWTEGEYNKYSKYMLYLNFVMVGWHYIQTHLFYDGLAATVPEVTALGSVVIMLCVVYALEIKRRGLVFGKFPSKDGKMMTEFYQFVKRYHGYVASFGIVYDFHYHPFEATFGHWSGFFYQLLLIWQSTLIFQVEHKNRYWTAFLEGFVGIHGIFTALYQKESPWTIFFSGFLFIFALTQLWGLPVIQKYLKSTTSQTKTNTRYLVVLIGSVVSFLIVLLSVLGAFGRLNQFYQFLFIPMSMYITTILYVIAYVISYKIEGYLIETNLLTRKSACWWIIGILYGIIINALLICSFALWFRTDLKLPYQKK